MRTSGGDGNGTAFARGVVGVGPARAAAAIGRMARKASAHSGSLGTRRTDPIEGIPRAGREQRISLFPETTYSVVPGNAFKGIG